MRERRKPVPKTQLEISQESIEPYLSGTKPGVSDAKNRANQRSLKNDITKQVTVGLQEIDTAIIYYFNNVLKLSVLQNGIKINIPVLYGSPEKWSAVQKDGYYRDKNGKIQAPLIMFKRDSIEKNRSLGNKMDANNPMHFSIFEKKYSKKNIYDNFAALNNRIPVKEYYGVIIPDYVDITYSCVVFTEYTEQMNKVIEAINFASDSFWGNPERFSFRAAIDTFTTVTELRESQDRVVRTTFTLKIAGYIIPDQINTSKVNPNKFYSKSQVTFNLETVGGGLDKLTATSKGSTVKDVTKSIGGNTYITNIFNNETAAEDLNYVNTNVNKKADIVTSNSAVFTNAQILEPAAGSSLPPTSVTNFSIFINGQYVTPSIITLQYNGTNTTFIFNTVDLGYELESDFEVTAIGKFQS